MTFSGFGTPSVTKRFANYLCSKHKYALYVKDILLIVQLHLVATSTLS